MLYYAFVYSYYIIPNTPVKVDWRKKLP
jgi:hypothetical protein